MFAKTLSLVLILTVLSVGIAFAEDSSSLLFGGILQGSDETTFGGFPAVQPILLDTADNVNAGVNAAAAASATQDPLIQLLLLGLVVVALIAAVKSIQGGNT